MKFKHREKLLMVSLLSVVICLHGLQAQVVGPNNNNTLKVGEKAPQLLISAWLRGEPLNYFEKGQIYVLEFGGTWCAPCRALIPHLTEIAKKYEGKIQIVSIYLEQGLQEPTPANIKRVKAQMDAMSGKHNHFKVAVATWQGNIREAWGGISGVPFSVIIDRMGKIAWKGNPSDLDLILEALVEGRDLNAVASQQMKQQQGNAEVFEKLFTRLVKAREDKKYSLAFYIMDSLIASNPKNIDLHRTKFKLLGDTGDARLYEHLRWMLDNELPGFMWDKFLNELGRIPRECRNYELDLQACDRAIQELADQGIGPGFPLWHKGIIYAYMGNYKKAIDVDSEDRHGFVASYKYLEMASKEGVENADAWVKNNRIKIDWRQVSDFATYNRNHRLALKIIDHAAQHCEGEVLTAAHLKSKAAVYAQMSDYKKAIEVLQQAIDYRRLKHTGSATHDYWLAQYESSMLKYKEKLQGMRK